MSGYGVLLNSVVKERLPEGTLDPGMRDTNVFGVPLAEDHNPETGVYPVDESNSTGVSQQTLLVWRQRPDQVCV